MRALVAVLLVTGTACFTKPVKPGHDSRPPHATNNAYDELAGGIEPPLTSDGASSIPNLSRDGETLVYAAGPDNAIAFYMLTRSCN